MGSAWSVKRKNANTPAFFLEEGILSKKWFKVVRNVFGKRPDGFATIGSRGNFRSDTIVEFMLGLGQYVNVAISWVYK